MSHAFRIVNVFTVDGDRFSGNPLCVFEDARGLSGDQMQALARQMNLSETTFVLPPTGDADAHVRIFTPGFEMPFAGHPTLGTASVVASGVAAGRDRVALEMIAGRVAVTTDGHAWTLRAARAPVTRAVEASRAELAQMVGLPADAVCDEPLWVDTGVEQLVIPIATAELVRAAKPVPELLERWGYSATRQEAMAYLWARGQPIDFAPPGEAQGAKSPWSEGPPLAGARGKPEWTVRFFFTLHGAVIEDPATGSACANLGGWMIARDQRLPVAATLRQGDAVGRPSRLGLRVDEDGGIYVTGAVIELGRGNIAV